MRGSEAAMGETLIQNELLLATNITIAIMFFLSGWISKGRRR